ncbi:prolyl 3-hydroxylase 2-like isoform X2 [Rhopilema esculentum]|uniref:prolyl 3-hydroxylase 2-like isoform X2 n=1 Tax=Rhopilema esculentum TaxID=499914 RepID=UPI0031DBFEBB|eukprot:gene13108-3895_t
MVPCVVFLLFCLNLQVFAGIEDIDLRYTQPAATFDELYSDAVQLYSNESWTAAIRSLQLALADYRHEREVRANCNINCKEKVDKSEILRRGKFDGGILVLYYVIRVRRCADLCQEKFMGRRAPIAKYIRDAFDKREPYNYLQYSYFKLKDYKNAASAALTYVERHPADSVMLKNLHMFAGAKYNVSIDNIHSMERQRFAELYHQGDKEYEEGKFPECIQSFEEALDEFYKAHKKCLALCDFQHEKHQASFSVGFFQHYIAVVQCRLACRDELSFVRGAKFDKYIENHYHYLQFCYHEKGKVKEAAENAKTYLLFQPEDPIMIENFKYYLKALNLDASDVAVRKRAKTMLDERRFDEKLLAVAKFYANPDVVFDDENKDFAALEEDENLIFSDDKDQENEGKPKDEKSSEKAEKEKSPKKLSNIVKKAKKWQKHSEFKGIKLFMEDKQLNGTGRFVIDNMASEEECKILSALVNKLSDFGDGYKHNHPDPKHPFTEKESFEGVNIKDAVLAAVNGDISLEEAEIYVNLSDKMRSFTEQYFELKQKLHIAYTHLVCRTAYSEAAAGDHISHPVHSDNCILGLDGPGTCPKVSPAYTWRDFSGVLYLNDGFEGGEFIFAHPNGTQQASVKPKCGRMVAFKGGLDNIHGVLGIRTGRRCALPLWFTLQEDKIEDNRGKYQKILSNLRKEKNELRATEGSGIEFKTEL